MSYEARRQCGRRLQEAREALGLTQEALGEKVGGVHQFTVSRWETGARMPSFETRLLLVKVVGFDPFAIEAPDRPEAVA